MCGAKTLLPLYAFMELTWTTLLFLFFHPSWMCVRAFGDVEYIHRNIYLMGFINVIYTASSILVTAQYKVRMLLSSDTGIVGCNTGSWGQGYLSAFLAVL
jgi:hypothetical protein